MTNLPAGGARDSHAGHDREAIAAFAAGDAPESDRTRAESLIHDCRDCARLADDLRAIAAATRGLPAPSGTARDFRLSAADAARLRGGPWRRVARALGLSAWNPRPFAAALTTLGVAGLLLAVLPFAPLGSGGARPEAAAATDQKAVFGAASDLAAASAAASRAASPATTTDASAGVPAAVYSGAARSLQLRNSLVPEDLAATAAPTTDTATVPTPAPPRQETPGSPLVFLSLGLIAAGGILFALARGSRGSR